MKKVITFLSMLIFSCSIANAQALKQNEMEKIIDDFVIASHNNLSFQNGMNVFITKPKDDYDALEKGFQLCHIDREQDGGWTILAAKDVIIEAIDYRAVLYGYQENKYIVLYKEEKNNEYYFRIYNSVYYTGNSHE